MQKYLNPVINCLLCCMNWYSWMSFAVRIASIHGRFGRIWLLDTCESAFRPRLDEYVSRDTFSSKTISFSVKTQRLYCIYASFSYCFMSFSAVYTKTMKTIENGKASGNLLFACQDNFNDLWLLLHRFQKFAFSVKTIRLYDNDIIITISFSNFSTLETVFKSYRFQWKRSSF